MDGSGETEFRAWSDSELFSAIEEKLFTPNDFVEASGLFSIDEFGLGVKNPALRHLSNDEMETLVVGGDDRREATRLRMQEIQDHVKEIRDPALRAVAAMVLNDYGAIFARSAGAPQNHHARRGGLADHTASMMRIARQLAPCFSEANADLIIVGILVHDIGKILECDVNGFAVQQSMVGELLGHIGGGVALVSTVFYRLLLTQPELFADRRYDEIRAHLAPRQIFGGVEVLRKGCENLA